MPSTRLRAAFLLFLVSGANGLLYQVVWVRHFVHVFGATVLAVSTVLAAFMGGLALGGAWGGRIAARLNRPLRTYGLLELALALYAGAVPWILTMIDPLYAALSPRISESFWALSSIRFVFSCLVLLPPTFLMGATLPILTRYAESLGEGTQRRVAQLYAVNTLGAVVGTIAASFLLLPSLGLARTLACGVLLNLLVAFTALWLGRRAIARAETPPADSGPSPGTPSVAVPATSSSISRPLVLATTGILGFAALAFEILWTRTLSLALGGTTYSFAIVLSVFLMGIAGGSAWAARLLRRHPARAQDLFVAIPAAIGLLAIALLPVFDRLPGLFMELSARGSGSWFEGILGRFVVTAIPLLPPTFLSGAAFPLAVGILRHRDGVGRSVGDVYAANTVGAILGSWAAGFLLIPAVGLRGGILVGAGLLAASTCGLLLARPSRRSLVLAGAVVAITALGVGMLPDWNRSRLTRGGFTVAIDLRRFGEADLAEDRRELVFMEEGITSTITVRRWGRELSMQMNGVTEASNTADLSTQIVMGGLGAVLHEQPRDVLVIGLGSGITASAAARHPGVERVDCVEISEAVARGARWFDEANNHILDDPRFHLIVGDGRNHLRMTDQTYDLIVSAPSNVWNSGVGSLMAVEFYEAAAAHLNPGGILVSWIQGYSLSSDALRSVLAAVRQSFPRASLWIGAWGDFVIVAGDEQLGFDVDRVLRKGSSPEIRSLIRDMETPDVLSLLAKNVLAGDALDRFIGDMPPNSDDNLYLEFEAPRLLHRDTIPELFRALNASAGGTEQFLQNAPPELLQELPRIRRAAILENDARLSFREGRGLEGMRLVEEALRLHPSSPTISRLLSQALNGRGETAQRQGRLREAAVDFLRATEADPSNAAPFGNLARMYLAGGRLDTAREASDEALRRSPDQPDYLADRAELHVRMRDFEEAMEWAQASLALERSNRTALIALGTALNELGQSTRADSVWDAAVKHHPGDEDLAARRARWRNAAAGKPK